MPTAGPQPLQPTLWRTARVLANRTRLKILRLLFREPGLTVSAVAQKVQCPRSLASEYLRALEARGLLAVRRVGRRVEYRPPPSQSQQGLGGLTAALRAAFQRESKPIESVFRLATAFTHPRRIEIYVCLGAGARRLRQLRAGTRISSWALLRHLKKLESRGFITRQGGAYSRVENQHGLAAELARLASA